MKLESMEDHCRINLTRGLIPTEPQRIAVAEIIEKGLGCGRKKLWGKNYYMIGGEVTESICGSGRTSYREEGHGTAGQPTKRGYSGRCVGVVEGGAAQDFPEKRLSAYCTPATVPSLGGLAFSPMALFSI